jgi:hypothetical protein
MKVTQVLQSAHLTRIKVALASFAAALFILHVAPAQAQQGSVQAVQKGRCPTNFQLNINTSANPDYAYCMRTTTQTVREYSNPPYQPCVPPGQYNANDEVPSGPSQGLDRCTVPTGIGTGPALPCPPTFPLRDIRANQVDRCYKNAQQTTTTYTNLQLFQ